MKKALSIIFLFFLLAFSFAACNNNTMKHDASGTFEADEVVVSPEESGKLKSFNVHEGDVLKKDSVIAHVDAVPINLQQEQIRASINALNQQLVNPQPRIKLLQDQLDVQHQQMEKLLSDKQRTTNLVNAGAATTKQLDEINSAVDLLKRQMDVTQQQINVEKNNIATQNRSILSQAKPLERQIASLQNRESKTNVVNPINGTVLTKYAMEGEVVNAGKPLYSIADLSTINLRAYITGEQLPQVKLGQQVKVYIDSANSYKEYSGVVTWISDKAEFTPKTIQTKEERANLVYAIKVQVKNDGYLKIGMYGEVDWEASKLPKPQPLKGL